MSKRPNAFSVSAAAFFTESRFWTSSLRLKIFGGFFPAVLAADKISVLRLERSERAAMAI
jgi:hypothetical protein